MNLNGIEKNCAWGGNSNQHILHELICNLINYKEGDWVIVGDTRPCRVMNFEEGEVRNTISDLGYSADSVKADPIAYDNLHFCCKKPCSTVK